jgi:pimeloyl-ACP methyl ester carboxylesterase
MESAIKQNMTSPDGATIGYQTVGCGPHVIVIPGVLSMAANYEGLANALAETFTVHTIERRGRGRSSPQGPDYCIATECKDVSALREKTKSPYLFGHSYGGLIALETARNNMLFKKVAVYEPAVSVDGSMPIAWGADYEKLLAQNKPLDAFVEFSAAVGPTRARNTPRWLMKLLLPVIMKRGDLRQKLELLGSDLREHRQIASLNNTYQNYAEVSAHTLLLLGGKSDLSWVAPAAVEKLSAALPSAQVKQFPGLNHFGPDQTGPREVAQAVRDYFAS